MSNHSLTLGPLTPVPGAAACCPPLTSQALSAQDAEAISPQLKALGDPVRLRLLSLVAAHDQGEACVCDLNDAFDLSQPTISHHLKVLHEAGLLERTKRGVWVYYRVRLDALSELATLLGGVAPEDLSGSRAASTRSRPKTNSSAGT